MTAQVEGFLLSPQQRFLCASEKEQRMNQCEVSLTGRLDVAALQAAIQATVDRHEILRTTFHRLPGMSMPLQRVEKSSAISFTAHDLRHLNGQEQEAEFQLISRREATSPIDLQSGPVLRACLVFRLPEEHILILTLPALCADRRSLENVLREISILYNAAGDGSFLEEPVQYVDAASMLNQFAEAAPSEPGKRFWSQQEIGKYLDSPIPYQANTLLEALHTQRSVEIEISSRLVEKLDSTCWRLQMSRKVFLLSCWQILFVRLAGELRFCTGVTFDGRVDDALSDAVGPYEKRLPFIAELQPGMSVKEVLLATNCMLENLLTWQDDFCCEQFDPDPKIQLPGATFGWCFDYYSRFNIVADGPLSFKLTKLIPEADRFKVLLSIVESGSELSAQLQYDPSNFEPDDVKRLSEQFQTLLADAIENPDAGIMELRVLPDSERAFLLRELNLTERDYAIECCAHQLFEQQVRRNPEALAVVFNDQYFSYAELNAKSNQLARKLQKLDVGPEVKVGLCTQRTPEMLVGILGILKAGGAYVPLDPFLPSERLGYMLQDSQSQVLVTQKGIELNFPQVEIPSIYLDSDGSEMKEDSADDLSSEVKPSNLAYVIYTSGSTGKPKGVAIEHRQLVNYVLASRERIGFDAHSFALLSTVAADLGNTSLFGALCAGGNLHLISQEVALDGKELAAYFRRRPINCVKIAPSQLAGLIASGPNLRLVLGGEASDWASIEGLQESKPDCSIFNHYGPTETTIGCCLYSVPRSENRSGMVPIGNPLSNIQLYVLDQEGQPVPLRVAGELYIGGAGVGRGYLNKPALTAEKYVPDGFSGRKGSRLYATGDVVRWNRQGELEFIGRRDNQVKIRGHRVELGEVEAALSGCPGVAQAVVVVEGEGAAARLVAYIVQQKGTSADVKQWQEQLRTELPQHMVPDQMIELEQMPLLPTGKIDRKALPRRESLRQKTRAKEKHLLDSTELQLIQVWKEVLCIQCVDITDNFFELGGNSLAAVSLCARLRKIYGAHISVRMVFDAPTIESMSVLVRQNMSLSPPSSVIPINPHGEKLPFFCMPAAGGIPHSYIHLAHGLGLDQPFYALQSYGLELGQEPLSRMEDMPATASRNVSERHLKIMDSYINAPQIHANAVKNPKMMGGPFIDYDGKRVDEIRALRDSTKSNRSALVELSAGIGELEAMLRANANGYSLQPLYNSVPEPLKGRVELVYDLNNNPSYRLIEPLLYNSKYYDESAQSLMLSMTNGDDRPFILSTPRLEDDESVHLRIAYRHEGVDELFRMKSTPKSMSYIRDFFDIPEERAELFKSFFTPDPPPPYQPYEGNAVRWRYFGHACILIETKGMTMLSDPVLSYTYESNISRYTYADLPDKIDYVLITHDHQDHVLFETLLQIRHKVETVIVPRGGGSLQDPSLKLILKSAGFKRVIELPEMDSIEIENGSITGLPFLGEHCDLDVRTKMAYLVRLGNNSLLFAADSCNIEPQFYKELHSIIGDVDALFLGMECDGAPLTWLYGPLLTQKIQRAMDESRRLAGSNYEQAIDIVNRFNCKNVYVYAMGQEPWLGYVMSLQYTEQSRPIVESNKLVSECRRRGIQAERLFGEKEIFLNG